MEAHEHVLVWELVLAPPHTCIIEFCCGCNHSARGLIIYPAIPYLFFLAPHQNYLL